MDRVKRIWYVSPLRAAKVQASLRKTQIRLTGLIYTCVRMQVCFSTTRKVPAQVRVRHKLRRHLSPVKRICVFEHSVIANFNCACPAIQRGQGSGFLPEGSA